MKIWITLLIAAACALPTNASERARIALAAGDFAEARLLGRSDGGVEGLMTACRAGMLLGGYHETGYTAIQSLHGAAKDCSEVLALDSHHLNARITLAIAVGFESKRWRKVTSARKSRRFLQQTLDDFPCAAAAHGALGGWHSEVSAAGLIARIFLGAKRKSAAQYFESALTHGERSLAFYLEYIKFLARGGKSERAKAIDVASKALDQQANDAVDRLMQAKILEIHTALTAADMQELRKALADATAFNGIEKWRDLPWLYIHLPE